MIRKLYISSFEYKYCFIYLYCYYKEEKKVVLDLAENIKDFGLGETKNFERLPSSKEAFEMVEKGGS